MLFASAQLAPRACRERSETETIEERVGIYDGAVQCAEQPDRLTDAGGRVDAALLEHHAGATRKPCTVS